MDSRQVRCQTDKRSEGARSALPAALNEDRENQIAR